MTLFFPTIAGASDVNFESEREARKFADQNNTWVIYSQQGTRNGNFYQYDATEEYMYFSYSKDSCVDVYNNNGDYLYSIIFPDKQNGAVGVRCENNHVYISAKNDTVYIFQDKSEIAQLSYEEAKAAGYDFSWFYKNKPQLRVTSNLIYRLDSNDNIISQIETPAVIAQSIPQPHKELSLRLLIWVLILLTICYIKVIQKK